MDSPANTLIVIVSTINGKDFKDKMNLGIRVLICKGLKFVCLVSKDKERDTRKSVCVMGKLAIRSNIFLCEVCWKIYSMECERMWVFDYLKYAILDVS